ncbi:MAG: STAS domain-containing protein, partial [Marinilabiliales bacterium]
MIKFKPKLFTLLKTYSASQFRADLSAGIIVGIVAMPIALAYAIASGVTPDVGLVTAVIAGLIVSVLGGSRVQIGGPSGAFIVIVYSIVQHHGIEGLLITTFMAGIMLVLMGLFRMGAIIRFMPYPIVVGFTSAIAAIIFTTQISPFFGLDIPEMSATFLGKWINFFSYLHTVNLHAMGLGMITILLIILLPKTGSKMPGSFVAIIVTTLLVYLFDLPVETLGSKYGEIASTIPRPDFPVITFEKVSMLIQPAFTIAMLCAIESLLSAMVADGYTGGSHRPNTELIAQGAANMVVPFFGGLPASGQIAKTMTNIRRGAKTPVAGIIHAAVLLVILLFLGRFAGLIPIACMAGMLIGVAYKMSEWHTFVNFLKYPRSDGLVLVTTFLLTLVFDLSIAIQVGLLMAMVSFLKRFAESSNIEVFRRDVDDESEPETLFDEHLGNIKMPKGIEIYEINGPFFFGVANKFDEIVRENTRDIHARIIRLRKVPFIDSTGLNNLENLYLKSLGEKIQLIFSGVHPGAMEAL